MGSQDLPPCSLCGKSELVYMFEGKPYCPACLTKKRPPLSHQGPERRKSQRPAMWRRRESDNPGRKPGKD